MSTTASNNLVTTPSVVERSREQETAQVSADPDVIPQNAPSAYCKKCCALGAQAIWFCVVYMNNIGSDIALAFDYLLDRNFQDGGMTLLFVLLPLIATIFINYLEENLIVETSNGCLHYFGFLPVVSEWKKFKYHRDKHLVYDNPGRSDEIDEKITKETTNAYILKNIEACFESGPQLILQLSIMFHAMSTFDGDLVSALKTANWLQAYSIFFSALSFSTVLFLKRQHGGRGDVARERTLYLMGMISRTCMLLVYASVATVSRVGVVPLALTHWLGMAAWLAISRPDGYEDDPACSTRHWKLGSLESLAHVFQYYVWNPRRDPRNSISALKITLVCEWLVFFAGLAWIINAEKQLPEYIMYKVGFGTLLGMILTILLFKLIGCIVSVFKRNR